MLQLSVIVPTYNRLYRLKQVLTALEHQSYPHGLFEVVVVSDGSTDGTNEYLGSYRGPLNLVVTIQENSGPAATRNLGIQRASGRLILFLDDDVVPTPQLIAEHIATHNASQEPLVVLGPMLTPSNFRMKPWVQWEQAMLVKQYQAMEQGTWEPTARQFYTGNTSLERRLLNATGGFDERFRRAEDVELAYRLVNEGVRFVFNGRAIGYHYAERSFRSWSETPYAYGRNDIIFTREKQQTWLLPAIKHEFRERRNPLIKLLVRLCLDRTTLSQGIMQALKHTATLSHHLGRQRLAQVAYSGIFNLRYYQGMADELGGRDHFFAEV